MEHSITVTNVRPSETGLFKAVDATVTLRMYLGRDVTGRETFDTETYVGDITLVDRDGYWQSYGEPDRWVESGLLSAIRSTLVDSDSVKDLLDDIEDKALDCIESV